MRKATLVLLALAACFLFVGSASAGEVLCYTEVVTSAPSFNIYTGRNDANNPILWSHSVPPGILGSVVRVGLYIEAYDVDYPANDEHDRVYMNGYDLGLLEGFNNQWGTVEKTIPPSVMLEGTNQMRIDVDELAKGWKVTIRRSEIRFYCAEANPDFSIGLTPATRDVQQGASATYTVTLTALNGFNSAVTLSAAGLPAGASASFLQNPVTPDGATQLTVTTAASTPTGSYTITVTGTGGGQSHSDTVGVTVSAAPDFTIDVDPDAASVVQAETASFTVHVSPINGHNSAVTLTATGIPGGATATFEPASSLPPFDSQLSIATTADTPLATSTITVTGTDGSKTHADEVELTVLPPPDFEISIAPASLSVAPGGAAAYAVSLSSLNGFDEAVDLSVSGLPVAATAVFSADPVTPTGTSSLTIQTQSTTQAGSYAITVQAVGGGLTHQAAATLDVVLSPDFTITVDPPAQTVTAGQSTTYTVTVAPLNGFASPVQLSVDGLPNRITIDLSDPRFTPPGTAVLTLTIPATGVAVGTYAFQVSGASGGLKHEAEGSVAIVEQTCPEFSVAIDAKPDSGSVPLEVHFRAVVTEKSKAGATYSYDWRFGDGATSTEKDPVHTFQKPGERTVTLTVRNDCADERKATKVIRVGTFNGSIHKSFSPSSAEPAQSLKLKIRVKNESSDDFSDVTVSDELDARLIYDGDTSGVTPRRDGRRLEWTFPRLAGKETKEFEVRIHVDESAAAGRITNTAYIEHESLSKPIASNTAPLEIRRLAVSVVKSVDKLAVEPGDEIEYQITIKNRSKTELEGLVLRDVLADELELVSQSGPLAFTQSGQTLEWRGALADHKDAVIKLKARVRETAKEGDTIRNQARLEAAQLDDPVDSNTVTTELTSEPISITRVSFRKDSDVPQADIGRIIRFRLTIDNRSASALLSPVIEDELPQGFAYVAGSSLIESERVRDPEGSRVLIWRLPAIPPASTIVLRYQVLIEADARRGKNVNRAVLRASDSSGQQIRIEASDFVNVSTTSITFFSGVDGFVFVDRDDDGLQSAVDTPIAGIEVRLSSGESSTTDLRGYYEIEGLNPGTYAVGVNRAALDANLSPVESPVVVSLPDGLTLQTDFAIKLLKDDDTRSTHIRGRVFLDRNANLKFDEGEPLVPRFRATLDDKLTTDGTNGAFELTHIEPGQHTIEVKAGDLTQRITLQAVKGDNSVDIPIKFSGISVSIQEEENR